jgi:hypothetical protein
MKRKIILIFGLLVCLTIASTISYFQFFQHPKETEFVGDFGSENMQYRNTATKNLSPYAIFGDSSVVLMTEHEYEEKYYLDILNPKDTAKVKKIRFETRTGYVCLLGENDKIISRFLIKPEMLGRFLSTDPKSSKYPALSPYHALANNPIITIDPDGGENIVVVGNQGKDKGEKPDSDKRNGDYPKRHFLERGFNEAVNLHKQHRQNQEATTLLIYRGEYTDDQIAHYTKRAEKEGINLIVKETASEIIDYANTSGGYVNGEKASRGQDLVTDFIYVGHGKPSNLTLDHDTDKDGDVIKAGSLSSYSFHPKANASLLGCGNGVETGNQTTTSIFDDFANRLAGGKVQGYRVVVYWGEKENGGGYSLGDFRSTPQGYMGVFKNGVFVNEVVAPENRLKVVDNTTENRGNPNNNKVNGQPLNN